MSALINVDVFTDREIIVGGEQGEEVHLAFVKATSVTIVD